MTCRLPMFLLLLLAVAAGGCRSSAARPLTDREAEWAAAIQRSYPGWRPAAAQPGRDRSAAAPETVPPATPATRRETVVEISLPAVPGPPSPAAAAPPAAPRAQPPKPVAEPEMDDVVFVPAD